MQTVGRADGYLAPIQAAAAAARAAAAAARAAAAAARAAAANERTRTTDNEPQDSNPISKSIKGDA